MNVAFVLKSYTKGVGQGTVLSNDAGLLTHRDPDTVRGVDVAVFLKPSWAGQPAPDGYTAEPPDLAVEVRSPEQPWKDLVGKAGEYLAMGARLVWVVDPQSRRVTVFSPDREPAIFAPENELDGGTELSGFRCRVADLFD